ncbi:uncharacterized protein PV06_04968 [Exophiala oligosperma]|uniref:FAD dependent oxidoreductase domain-containing protein n=2 Tax=Chaetothyriales TaxID=34395 RepID=A0A0D2DLT7_9EURO|nr:uncharacterized protein PV06_04968 [Exophiala oligosperma]KAJ9630125.1 hypothetical protein H2204_008630 [Knufia peltigerae]KIW43918.1 hypothetical protein PV06_04968 [Exophiala oligosperma]
MAHRPGKRVAVIGAGISGVSSAAHLLKHGLEVVVFERSSIAGGVWHFDPRSAQDPTYPNEQPSRGDYEIRPELEYRTPPPEVSEDDKETAEELEIAHAPPGPCYAGLMNNVSTREMRTSLQAWPPGTTDFVGQSVLEEYIQSIARDHGVASVTQYNTRVENVQKVGSEWVIRTTTLRKDAIRGCHFTERRWAFDCVVVASGHYQMPRIPDLPGLHGWKQAYPERVWHSKKYRDPRQFKDKNILLIGAGVSSYDIAKESAPYARRIFQSSRGGKLDLPASMMPEKATRVGGVRLFKLDGGCSNSEKEVAALPIPGKIVLEDGEELSDIHAVILCTGYITSYPFFPHLHSDTTPAHEAGKHVLVTAEGNMVHNLYKDIFYIEDPSLAFVGAPYHIATFSLFEFQAQIVARVLSGKALLPSYEQMREEYAERVRTKGLGRDFHSLRGDGQEIAYVDDLVAWANTDAEEQGIDDKMKGHTEEWHAAYLERKERLKFLRVDKTGQGEDTDLRLEAQVV